MEKQPKSEEDLLRTDAFDILYIGCDMFPQHGCYPISVGGKATSIWHNVCKITIGMNIDNRLIILQYAPIINVKEHPALSDEIGKI